MRTRVEFSAIGLVPVLLVVCALPADNAFDRRFKEVSAAILKGTRTDSQKAAAFFKAAADAKSDTRMQAALLEQALAHGLEGVRDATCRDVAWKSLGLLADVAPEKADVWRSKSVELARRCYRVAAGRRDKLQAGAKLVTVLVHSADRHEGTGRWRDAAGALAEARRIAAFLRRPDAKEISQRYVRARHFAAVRQNVRRLEGALANRPGDAAIRRALLLALVVDLDEPVEAAKHLNEHVGQTWTACLPLAAKPLSELKAAACRQLGDWYWKELLAKAASPYSRATVLTRARLYYERFLKLAPKQDTLLVKVALGKVVEALKDLPALPAWRYRALLLQGSGPAKTDPIAMSVREPWPFSVKVTKGQKIRITATGRWRIFPGGRWRGPNDAAFYLQGRLDDGKPFRVGSDLTLDVKADAILYLGMREGGRYGNNRGEIQVVLERVK
jgi:hypothetical protein